LTDDGLEPKSILIF